MPDSKLVDINTASMEELMTLPGIGRAEANDIIDNRRSYGPYFSLDELLEGDAEDLDGTWTEEVVRGLEGKAVAVVAEPD